MQSETERNVLLALGWYYPEIHRGVARYARDHHWHITFDFDDPVPVNWQGDGILTLLGAREDQWRALKHFRGPIVDLAESRPDITLPRVTMDNQRIGELAAEYFLGRGYRHFAFIHRWDLGVSARRRDSFSARLHASGHEAWVFCWQQERGSRQDSREERIDWLIHHLQRLPRPTAVFGTRDIDAAEVIEACMLARISVPDEVAVLGVDNAEMICECMRIPLSSIDNNLERVGYEGAALLHQLMNGAEPPLAPSYIAPVGLVERRSTDHLAVDHPQVAQALQIMHQEYQQPVTMQTLLERLPISRSGLEKAFRDHFIRSPMEELRHIRFQKACQLLAETDLKIAAVAYRTGFATSHNLCRSFKQQFGMTPKQYREKYQKSDQPR